MKDNNISGSDGLTANFYKVFWNDMKVYVVKSFNYLDMTGDLKILQNFKNKVLLRYHQRKTKILYQLTIGDRYRY